MRNLFSSFRFLMIVGMVLATLCLGTLETVTCQTVGEHAQDEFQAFAESHCACAHDSETLSLQGSLMSSLSGCGGGCACVPARTGWQSTLSNRVKDGSRGEDTLARADTGHFNAYKAPTRLSTGICTPAHEPPLFDSILYSIRTIVLLT